MNVYKVFVLFGFILMIGCQKDVQDRWEIAVMPLTEKVIMDDVSKVYYDLNQNNQVLKAQFPEFFAQAPDSLLDRRRQDPFAQALHQSVSNQFNANSVQDSLLDVFARLKHYYPQFQLPHVYLFTGELNYQNPVIYYPKTAEMVIGLDWFLGEDYPAYEKMNIPIYFKRQMNPNDFKIKVVESLADHMVKYDIQKRKFIEKLIYEGKLLVVQDALLPEKTDAAKIGYTPEQINWAKENEAQVYMYFTEQELFYSDDKLLDDRFINDAPFSKFFSDNDAESPGKIGTWMGWQICRSYLQEHPEVTLQEFLSNEDYQQIFASSGYKPTL